MTFGKGRGGRAGHRGPLAGAALIAAILLLAVSCAGLAGDWHWRLDLLAHFRWQYLIAGTLLLGWSALVRHRNALLVTALACLINALSMGRMAWFGDSSAMAVGNTLRLVSLNVLTTNPHKQRVLDYLLATDADLVFLMEVDEKWITALAALDSRYPYRIAMPRADNFGVALFSRVPLQAAQVVQFGGDWPSIQAMLNWQGREMAFIGTHLLPPVSESAAAAGRRQIRELVKHVSELTVPVLLAGDMNSTPWSAGMRSLTAGGLAFGSADPPGNPTWRVGSIFALPIDHVLVAGPLVVAKRSVGPDVGSDHRPLDVRVGWAPVT